MSRGVELRTPRPQPPGWSASSGSAFWTWARAAELSPPCCTDAGHEVFCLDRDVDRVAGLPERLGTRLHVAGQVESLPYPVLPLRRRSPRQPRLHRFAPGLALTEIARVLSRADASRWSTTPATTPSRGSDGSAALLQEVDPQAMRGDFGADSLEPVAESPYFVALEHRNFRNWVPITRSGLLAMVERRPAVRAAGARRTRPAAGRRRARCTTTRPGRPTRCCCRSRPRAGGPRSTTPRSRSTTTWYVLQIAL